MPADRIEQQLAQVADRFSERIDELVQLQVRLARAFASYEVVPRAEFERSARRNVARVIASLRGAPDQDVDTELDERTAARHRALQGVPSVDVLASYRVGIAALRDEFYILAQSDNISPEAIVVGTQRIWEMGDKYSNVFLSALREIEFDLVRGAEQHRIAMLARLLEGTMATEEMVAQSAALGLVSDGRYWVVRAHTAAIEPSRAVRMIESHVGVRNTLIAGVLNGDVAALLSAPIRSPALGELTMAIAGPLGLEDLTAGYAEVTQLLDAARRFGRTGIIDRNSMALRLAVTAQSNLGQMLYTRYVEPVLAASPIADLLLETIGVYLEQRRSVADAAVTLSVHVNTLRYRLERFSALTGADLQQTETLFEVWWALEYKKIQPTATKA